jgi:hypothetical protein
MLKIIFLSYFAMPIGPKFFFFFYDDGYKSYLAPLHQQNIIKSRKVPLKVRAVAKKTEEKSNLFFTYESLQI